MVYQLHFNGRNKGLAKYFLMIHIDLPIVYDLFR